MFVEGEVEVAVKDSSLTSSDDYDVKMWLQKGFASNACYRISKVKMTGRTVRAVVALNTRVLPEAEWRRLESTPPDPLLMAQFLEKAFIGKGSCKSVGSPSLKGS
jgi:hypothetical protein